MKKIEVEISSDYGFAHYGGQITDGKESSLEISDTLADFLRPKLDDGLDMLAVDDMQIELGESNPDMAAELSQLYDDIQHIYSDLMMEYCLEEDKEYYNDDSLDEFFAKDIREGRFIPTYPDKEVFYEAHKDEYESADDYDLEDDYESAVWKEYMEWVEHLELYERAERCFGDDFSPMDRSNDWDYTILSIEE